MVNDKAGATSLMANVFTTDFLLMFLLHARDIIQPIHIATRGAIVFMDVWPLLNFKLLFKDASSLLSDKII